MQSQKKIAAVVIPVYKCEITPDEEKSLFQLDHVLNKHDRFFLKPHTLQFSRKGFLSKNIKPEHLASIYSYNKFLLKDEFYRLFQDYEYILIHQLDCLVFSDQLTDWCKQGYDYIGAPWFVSPQLPWLTADAVGNGGFSLRNVQNCLRVLKKFNSDYQLRKYASLFSKKILHPSIKNEDLFWSFEAKKYYADFKIPTPLTALGFSFEVNPRGCWEKNKRRMPFGCHAWARYDKSFWEERMAKENE